MFGPWGRIFGMFGIINAANMVKQGKSHVSQLQKKQRCCNFHILPPSGKLFVESSAQMSVSGEKQICYPIKLKNPRNSATIIRKIIFIFIELTFIE
jgi:hypothetical protein